MPARKEDKDKNDAEAAPAAKGSALLKRIQSATPSPPPEDVLHSLLPDDSAGIRSLVQQRLLEKLGPVDGTPDNAHVRTMIEDIFNTILADQNVELPRKLRRRLCESIVAEVIGLGPLEALLDDPNIVEIMVIGHQQVYVQHKGIRQPAQVKFEDDNHLRRMIDRLVAPLGKRVDEQSPILDTRMPDGTRINIVLPPAAADGPVLTIRKFSRTMLTAQQVINYGTASVEVMEFLRACVHAGFNILISGSAGSGKTTLLNILAGFVPDVERIVTIEDTPELDLHQEHVIRLETRGPNAAGESAITMSRLVKNTRRMAPDRIIVGNISGAEALDLIQAINVGHDGTLMTLYARHPQAALVWLGTLCGLGDPDIPARLLREQISWALDLIVHIDCLSDGSRKIMRVSEVQGLEGDTIVLADLFVFEQTGMKGRRILGRITPTGMKPKKLDKLLDAGIRLPPAIFGLEE